MYIKDELNDTISNSKNEKELLSNLHSLASKYIGRERANDLLDIDDNYKDSAQTLRDAILSVSESKANEKVADEIYKGTPEAKYLQPIYDVADPALKALSVLGKPVSVATAAGRTVGKGANALINAINPEYGEPFTGNIPIYEEIKSPFPTPEGSFTADFRENYPQEGFLKDVLPEKIKQQFPKATSAIENLGPYDVADMAVESLVPKAMKAVAGGSLESSMESSFNNTKKALIRMSDGLSEPNKLRLNKNLDRIAQRVLDEPELLKRLGKPEEMEKYLLGEGVGKRTRYGSITEATKSVGELESAASELSRSIGKYGNVSFDNPKLMRDYIAKKVMRRSSDLGSGSNYTIDNILNEIDSFMKTDKHGKYSFEDIVKMKRNVSKKLFDLGKSTYDPSSPSSLKHMVAEELWSDINRQIRKVAKATGDTSITDANARFNDLASIRDIMGTTVTKGLKAPSLKESLIGGSAMAMGAMGAGMSPWQASLIGGIYPVGRAVERGMANSYPSYAARASKIAQKGYGVMKNMPSAPLGIALASYEIPRNSAKIKQEADLVLAKLAQNTNTPEGQVLFDAVHDAIMNNPHKIPVMMKALSTQMPEIFSYDQYNSFDGIVPFENRKAALKSLNNSKTLSNSQKAEKIKALITDGYMDEY